MLPLTQCVVNGIENLHKKQDLSMHNPLHFHSTWHMINCSYLKTCGISLIPQPPMYNRLHPINLAPPQHPRWRAAFHNTLCKNLPPFHYHLQQAPQNYHLLIILQVKDSPSEIKFLANIYLVNYIEILNWSYIQWL